MGFKFFILTTITFNVIPGLRIFTHYQALFTLTCVNRFLGYQRSCLCTLSEVHCPFEEIRLLHNAECAKFYFAYTSAYVIVQLTMRLGALFYE